MKQYTLMLVLMPLTSLCMENEKIPLLSQEQTTFGTQKTAASDAQSEVSKKKETETSSFQKILINNYYGKKLCLCGQLNKKTYEDVVHILKKLNQEKQAIHDIDLSSNKLGTVPSELNNLKSLRSLNVSSNKLSHIPQGFCSLISLETLSLDDNDIKKLPSKLHFLTKLVFLDLANNPNFDDQATLEQLIAQCPQLKDIRIHNTRIDANKLREKFKDRDLLII